MNVITFTRIRLLNVIIIVLIIHLIPNNVFSQYSSHNMGYTTNQKGRLPDNYRQRHTAMTENRFPASWGAFDFNKPTELIGDVEMAWVNTYASGLAGGAVRANAVAVDNSGNVYVAGGSGGLIRGRHGNNFAVESALIIKYNAAGVEQWDVDYYGGGNRSAEIMEIAVDDLGSVYVTGNAGVLSCNGWDGACSYENEYMFTAKYNPAGVEQWVVEYDGGGDGGDGATAIALDASNNVYVTGDSWSSETNGDYVTIKYSSDGIEEWVARYDGPSSKWDFPKAIAIDDLGNIYVTGSSQDSTTGDDYATVKYSSDGIEQWVARYDGPSSEWDFPKAMAIDDLGNVYVTGSSYDSSYVSDYITVKYSSDGVELWVARYDGQGNTDDYAVAIAVDGSGDIYVTGFSSYTFGTIKYDSTGVEQWVARYDDSGNSYNFATAIAIDAAGNVIVTGRGLEPDNWPYNYGATVKYSSDGIEQWAVRYEGSGSARENKAALALDSLGNVFIAGYSEEWSTLISDLYAAKYSPEGVEEWVSKYGVNISRDLVTAITHDASGNVYVTGSSRGSTSGDDYATVKYNSDGIQQWVARYNGPVDGNDVANAIAVDELGNVYVTGSSYYSSYAYDYVTIKYNIDGVEQWVARYHNGSDYAISIAVDGSGNVYVAGSSWADDTGKDYVTIMYNTDGVEQWAARYNGPADEGDGATAIAIDDIGNVYVTGSSYDLNTWDDYATLKYNSDGVEQWAARYNGPGDDGDKTSSIALDDLGNVYVTGSSYGLDTWNDYATLKYNSDGERQWVARYNGPGNGDDYARSIAVDGSGNVYVTGESYGLETEYDYATVKYSSDGVRQWVARYNSADSSWDGAAAIEIDKFDNIYVTGTSGGGFVSIMYDRAGVEQWIARYDESERDSYDAIAMSVDNSGNVYVAGNSSYFYRSAYTIIKYTQNWVSVEGEAAGLPTKYTLLQSYPNPFNPTTTIEYALPHSGEVSLIIYNLLGEEISRLVNGQQDAGYHNVSWNASNTSSGIYFYRLQSGDFIQTRKMLLLK